MMKRLVDEALNVCINKNAFAYISDPGNRLCGSIR